MAVDFSVKATGIDSQIQPSAQIVQPVSRQNEIDALETIGRGVVQGAKTVATIFQNNAASKQSKFLSDFSIKLNGLQDAADQGLSAMEVRTRSRALLTNTLANAPNMEEDILKRYSTWLNQSGVDKIATPDQQRYAIEQKQVEAAVSNGFLASDKVGDPDAQKSAIDNLEKFQASVRELETTTKEVNAQSARLDLKGKQRQAVEQENETRVTDSLSKVAQAALPYWRTQYENIKAAAAKATSEQERQQIIKQGITQLQTDFAQRTAAMAGDGLSTNQAKLDQILKPQKDLIDVYVKELDGTYDTDMYKRMSDGAMARAEALAMGKLDDKTREWIALSKTSQGLGAVLGGKIAADVATIYAKNASASTETAPTGTSLDQAIPNRSKPADILPTGDQETKSVKDYLNSVTQLLDAKYKGTDGMLGEDKIQFDKEIDAQMTSIFKGVNVYANSVESAKEFQPLIDFLSNPTVGQYLQERGGIPTSIRGEVAQVLTDGYDKQVIPLLQQELGTLYNEKPGKGVGQTMKLQPASELVEPSFEGNRFGFKLKEGVQPNLMNDLLLKKMNNSAFSKVFNKMIISNSHVQGNTDYQKSYDELAPQVFGTGEAGSDQQGSLTAPDGTPIQMASLTPKATDPNLDLAELVDSPNPDVVQEVLDARDERDKKDNIFQKYSDNIDTANSRGYEPDISNLRPELSNKVLELQKTFGAKLPVVSGYRDPARNARAGGAKHSQHMHGNAVDIDVSELPRSERIRLIKQAQEMGFKGIGVYPNSIHLDLGRERAWGPNYHRTSLPTWAELALAK